MPETVEPLRPHISFRRLLELAVRPDPREQHKLEFVGEKDEAA